MLRILSIDVFVIRTGVRAEMLGGGNQDFESAFYSGNSRSYVFKVSWPPKLGLALVIKHTCVHLFSTPLFDLEKWVAG